MLGWRSGLEEDEAVMTQHTDDATKDRAADAAPGRPWVKPVLVEYGHLAKLTRGGSGAVTEPGSKKMCL